MNSDHWMNHKRSGLNIWYLDKLPNTDDTDDTDDSDDTDGNGHRSPTMWSPCASLNPNDEAAAPQAKHQNRSTDNNAKYVGWDGSNDLGNVEALNNDWWWCCTNNPVASRVLDGGVTRDFHFLSSFPILFVILLVIIPTGKDNLSFLCILLIN